MDRCNLPVISASDDDPVLQVEFAVVDGGRRALGEVCVTEYRLHALKLLAVTVKDFVAELA